MAMNKKTNSILFLIVLCLSLFANLLFLTGSNLLPKEFFLRVESEVEIKNLVIAGVPYGDINKGINYQTGYRTLNFSKIDFLSNGWFINLLKKIMVKIFNKRIQKLTLKINQDNHLQLNQSNSLESTNSNKNNLEVKNNNKEQSFFSIQFNEKKFNLSIQYEK